MKTRDGLIEDLTNQVKSLKIKSITVNEEVYDFRSTYNIKVDDDIKISNKYVPILISLGYSIDDLNDILQFPDNINIIKKDGKLLSLGISNHAMVQMIKRLVYIHLNDIYLTENNYYFDNLINENINFFIDVLINSDWNEFSTNTKILSIFKSIVINSKVFNDDNIKLTRDRKSFNRRDKENPNTIRYYYYPLLFIGDNNILKTVELYSNNIDMRHHNKVTSNNIDFLKWLKEVKSI